MVASLCSQKATPLWTSRPSWEGLAIKTGSWRSGGFGRRCWQWVLDLGKNARPSFSCLGRNNDCHEILMKFLFVLNNSALAAQACLWKGSCGLPAPVGKCKYQRGRVG